MLSVVSEAPSLTLVAERVDRYEIIQSVDEADLVLPGQLVCERADHCEPLTPVFRREPIHLHDLAGRQFDFADSRVPSSCALEKKAIRQDRESLREGQRVMWPLGSDFNGERSDSRHVAPPTPALS